jgi:hypothetical protein
MIKNTDSQLNAEKEGRLFKPILLLGKDYYRGKFITGNPGCQLNRKTIHTVDKRDYGMRKSHRDSIYNPVFHYLKVFFCLDI